MLENWFSKLMMGFGGVRVLGGRDMFILFVRRIRSISSGRGRKWWEKGRGGFGEGKRIRASLGDQY